MKMPGKILVWFIIVLAFHLRCFSQDVLFSAPQKVTAGYAKVEVIGRNSQGILIRLIGKNDDEIAAYYDNLQLRWKKATPRKDKNAKLEEIVMYDDSLIFFYTIALKNATLLKAFKTNAKLESKPFALTCDTINHSIVNANPAVNFSFSADKGRILIYYPDAGFHSNNLLHMVCFNSHLHSLWKTSLKVKGVESPELIDGIVDASGAATIVVGASTVKNYNNDFPYSSYHTYKLRDNGRSVKESVFAETNHFLGICKTQMDVETGNLVIAGLYSSDPGTESEGAYFFMLPAGDSSLIKKFESHSTDFLAQLSGNNPPRRSDGFFDFQPKDLIITRDGGAILITESESVSAESYTSNNFGTFGISSGFTVNYYHYDDIIIFSFQSNGELEWKQILHKKQGTEGDGGYYSSFATVIAPSALHFIYNDVVNGQTNVAGYRVDVSGNQQRTDIFNADRKGVMLIPQSGKQISPDEVLLPSLKRNYLQFVKLRF